MKRMRLGRTGLTVNRTAFGVLPLQRTDYPEAVRILRRAYEGGIDFYDTARSYSNSEEKIGMALADVRKDIILATKSPADNRTALIADVETSLKMLKTDYIDILQLHNPTFVPKPGDESGLYDGLLELKKQGKIRFIGITNHRLNLAQEAVDTGLYDTLQFPLCYLSGDEDLALSDACRKADMGLIAMKALSGGLITDARPAYAFLNQYDNVLPIWGIQHMYELEEFLELASNPPVLNEELQQIIDHDRKQLVGAFCRGCGYCLPCPADIPINMAARMSLLLRRAPYQEYIGETWQANMERIENCIDCGHCREHCPYGLDTPELLRTNLADFRQFVAEHK